MIDMERFHIYTISLILINNINADQIREVLENNTKFNKASIVEQERGLAMIIADQGRPNFLQLVDEAKKEVEAVYGRCFIYDPKSVKDISF